MEKLVILLCLLTAASAFFFTNLFSHPEKPTVCRVCIYSVNPKNYTPSCFLCPNKIYPTVLKTCVNSSSLPNNVTFTQANCIEQNCKINSNIKKRSIDDRHQMDLNGTENIRSDEVSGSKVIINGREMLITGNVEMLAVEDWTNNLEEDDY